MEGMFNQCVTSLTIAKKFPGLHKVALFSAVSCVHPFFLVK